MLTLRYIVRLTVAFFQRFKAIIFFAIILGVIFFFIISLLANKNTTRTQIIGITGKYTVANLPILIQTKITKGLTKVDENGTVSPDIASSWETPDKGKTWVFNLNKNSKWQDGKQVKSSDITYDFNDVTVSYPDDFTIQFKLQNSYSAFPYIVSRPIFKKGLIGLSQWKVKNLSLSGNFVERMTLVNPDKQTIIYRFFPTEERTRLAFKLGQVNEITEITDPTDFSDWKKIKIEPKVNTGEYVGVFFNTQDKVLGEKTLRQALSYAIDKSEYDNGGNRALGPISSSSWAYNSQVKTYKFDQEKAKNIITQFKKDSKLPELEINLLTYPVLLTTAEKVAHDWEAIGVKVNVTSVNSQPNDFQAFLAIFDTPEDPDQYSIWHSTQTETNITHYQNSRIDKLLEDGRSEIDINNRIKIYLDFQRFLVEEAPVAFLYYPKTYTISR